MVVTEDVMSYWNLLLNEHVSAVSLISHRDLFVTLSNDIMHTLQHMYEDHRDQYKGLFSFESHEMYLYVLSQSISSYLYNANTTNEILNNLILRIESELIPLFKNNLYQHDPNDSEPEEASCRSNICDICNKRINGKILTCVQCERVNHERCIKNSLNNTKIWSLLHFCISCQQNDHFQWIIRLPTNLLKQ